MSNKSILRYFVVLLFAAFSTAALVTADVGALAQNSGGTPEESMQEAGNTNMSGPRRARGRRGRRGRRRAARPAADATTTDATTDTTGSGTGMGTGAGQADGGSGDIGGEQTDLSGTYTGRVTMTGGHEMSGEGTLTITGNTFTLAVDTMNHSGRVTAVTTRGYTGASFFFSDVMDTATNTPVVATVRAHKRGERLTLSPVPGTRTRLTFGSGGGGTGRGRRGRRAAAVTEPTSTVDVVAPTADPTGGTEATGTEATGTGTSTTGRGRRGRRGRRGGATNTNANMGDNSNMGGNSNTGDNSNTTPPM